MIAPIYQILFFCVLFSVVFGAWLRMFIQSRRDGKFPGGEEWELTVAQESFIAACAGVFVWLIAIVGGLDPQTNIVLQALIYLGAAALGYAGADAIEALLKTYEISP